jgi:hypothetical protein
MDPGVPNTEGMALSHVAYHAGGNGFLETTSHKGSL